MVAEVLDKNSWFNWSLTQLSSAFGVSRETVQRRLRDANITESGIRRGHAVYDVSHAAKAILMPSGLHGMVTNDPEKMTPKERADWFRAEKDRLIVEKESGIAVSCNDAREQMSFIAKTGLHVLETLPDILERDYSLSPEVILDIEKRIDMLRNQWANLLEEAK